jgi:signal transduction histidine kinase
VDLLTRKAEMNGEAQAIAKFVVDGAARMTVLIDDLLSFASAGVHESPHEVNLMHAAAQAVQSLAAGLETKAEVTVDPLPMVMGHDLHLTRLFQNLFSNAVKYRGTDPVKIQVTAERRGSDWVIRVKDNGIGIAAENQTRVFQPFVRLATRDVPGTGLGLAVCKKIVEERGGELWVESELGKGSTFCFTIAAMEEGKAATAPVM